MLIRFVKANFLKTFSKPSTRIFLLAFGILFFLPMGFFYLLKRRGNAYKSQMQGIRRRLEENGEKASLEAEIRGHVEKKLAFFGKGGRRNAESEIAKILEVRLDEHVKQLLAEEAPEQKDVSYRGVVAESLENPAILLLFIISGFPALLFLLLMSNPYVKYIYERLIMMVFVVFGVTFLVFTILYISPMDASYNMLGENATQERRDQFNATYGLDKPYIQQLVNTFKGIVTLNPGISYQGGEKVIAKLMNKFPITLQLAFSCLLVSVLIAVPSGVLSALKPNSILDYAVMLIALIGLSIPVFWFGLILILNLSIHHHILRATFEPGSWKAYIMPAIVLGTSLAASVARTTRSSMLEVINQDYIVTAKAKGLSRTRVILRHALGNALIPIVTLVGMQFGIMLGGTAVTEMVFNIPGIGSWLVEKQFIPDAPVVVSGVVYIAIVISLMNLFVDILYAFLDPRIKARIKGY
ncbi:MAG: ABC transporter permease [Clostridiales bacterium]|jgi:peptide/nickel transport system permease protein|nr:ABC transporter permease [Clostridiales bacterium]